MKCGGRNSENYLLHLSINHELECGTTDFKNKILISQTDLAIKEPVVHDAMKLAFISPQNALELDEFGSYERVECEIDEESVIYQLDHIYRKI